MNHIKSLDDEEFQHMFEACEVSPGEFDHAAHVRLAYIYLCDNSVDDASEKMKQALIAFLIHLGADQTKYHATITRAWIMAADHFMNRSESCSSATEFINCNPQLLDNKIMLTHYSAQVLFSPAARKDFVAPDIEAIPVQIVCRSES